MAPPRCAGICPRPGRLGAILAADAKDALAAVDSAHGAGVDPQALIAGLLDMIHLTVRAKLAGSIDPARFPRCLTPLM